MEILEMKERERLRREEVAERLHALADALARHNDVEFDRGGIHFRIKVPDEVNLKVELEIEDDGTELEIELTW
jgi:amphi-Trp domain-containing protein